MGMGGVMSGASLGRTESVWLGFIASYLGTQEERREVLKGVSINVQLRPGLWGEEDLRYYGGFMEF
jgi:hypothetical protein